MNVESLREYCLSFKGVSESFPFDETTLVFKVMNKIFLITDINHKPIQINVKCDPVFAVELRESYESIIPGYHMNKKHWNTITLDGSINAELIKRWITDSYYLVLNTLPKKEYARYVSLT